jgi:invasion protein IalB
MIEPQGEVRKILRITFPLGMQLKYGTRLIVHGVDPLRGPYTICSAAGCMADYEATPALLTSMKAGEMLVVQAIDQLGKQLSVTLSLADFWVAHDGPGTEPVIDETEAPRRPWQDDTLRPDDLGHT